MKDKSPWKGIGGPAAAIVIDVEPVSPIRVIMTELLASGNSTPRNGILTVGLGVLLMMSEMFLAEDGAVTAKVTICIK